MDDTTKTEGTRRHLRPVVLKRGLGSGPARGGEDRPHGSVGEERAAKIVVGWQGVGEPCDECRAPPPICFRVGTPASPLVHPSRGRGEAPFDDRRLAPRDGG